MNVIVETWWTSERVEQLTKLWAEGRTGSEIAAVFAVTRNTVIGKVSRLGLPQRSQDDATRNMFRVRHGGQKMGASALKRAQENSARGLQEKTRRVIRASGSVSQVRMRPQPEAPGCIMLDITAAKPWLERTFGECAYPVLGELADTLSCCLPARRGKSYCAGHLRIMYAPNRANKNLIKASSSAPRRAA